MPESLSTPESNLNLARYLYLIEVSLRELIIESLAQVAGPRWYKQRLPQPIYEDSLARLNIERTSNWTSYVSQHPIYYTNFTELKIIIERRDNWKDVFEDLFHNKDVFVGTLAELDPIRNKIAHNRRATDVDVQIALTALEKLKNGMGADRFTRLLRASSESVGIRDLLRELLHETEVCFASICEYKPRPQSPVWSRIEREWWFDDDYLGVPLEPVRYFFQLATDYAVLPRNRGDGHQLERWLTTSGFKDAFRPAHETVRKFT